MMKPTLNTNEIVYHSPKRIFEDSGTVNPQAAYWVELDNVTNTKNQDFKTMIDRGRYFSIFAPRQSGKTTFLRETAKRLHHDSTYIAIILTFQDYKNLDKLRFYSLIETSIYTQLLTRLNDVNCEKTEIIRELLSTYHLTDHISFRMLFEKLNKIILLKKIVIFIDEFDGIPLNELEDFLNALRSLYQEYKDVQQKALYSIGIIGVRNITKLIVGGVSPFNIIDHVNLPPFSLNNIRDLYNQYTEETNQPFTEDATKRVHDETAGQPWLVNRIGTILTTKIKPGTVTPINETDVDNAIEILLTEKNPHFDNLYEKAKLYKETFIEIVFDHVRYKPDDEDQSWLEQYGLIKMKDGKAITANNIYKARYTNTFFDEVMTSEGMSVQRYGLPGNRLDMESIILDFEQYIAQIGVQAFYEEKKPYEKTGQFLLTAWLYQFVKCGEGELRYEMKTGLGIMDVILTYKTRKYIIETKLNRTNLNRLVNQGVSQIAQKYLSPEFCNEGYLIVFDIKTPIGESPDPQHHTLGDKNVTSFIIGIGR